MTLVAVIHLASTFFMVGLVWFVQVVHYPLFGEIGERTFVRCQSFHLERTSFVVGPPMLVELLSGLALCWLAGGDWLLLCSLALLGAVWLSTFFLQVPKHQLLAQGFDSPAHSSLVKWNWLRTTAWTGRGLLLILWFARAGSGTRPCPHGCTFEMMEAAMSETVQVVIPDELLPALEMRAREAGMRREDYAIALLAREMGVGLDAGADILSDEFADGAALAGRHAREGALAAGQPVVNMDESGRYVQEWPDGRRVEVRFRAGEPRDSHIEVVGELSAAVKK